MLGNFDRGKKSDGYATGLIVYVLQISGLSVKDSSVNKGLNWLKSHQKSSGRWFAYSVNKDRDLNSHVGKFMSDAATAYASMALIQSE